MRHLLTEYNNTKVEVFTNYVESLKNELNKDGELANAWSRSISDEAFANLYKKEAEKGMFIDGESITIQFRKKLVVSYDYHAYKNRVIKAYPESTFDFQVVYKGDEFSFKKESGKVEYSHTINNPFDSEKQIIGAYGVIKNKAGEFFEPLTLKDIEKMKKSSKMGYIWNTWFDRMVLKSAIKRICSSHFHDITKDLDATDNEMNDPNRASMPSELLESVDNVKTKEELTKIYNSYINTDIDRKVFLQIIKDKKNELLEVKDD